MFSIRLQVVSHPPQQTRVLQEGVGEAADWASQVLVRSLTLNDIMLLIIPSCCYFLCIALAGMGMLLIPASMAFMVQSSCIVFTAACTVLAFPSRKLNNLHIRGIASCMVGVGIVSFAGYVYTLDEERRALHSLLNPPPPPESSLPPYILPPQYSLLSGAWDSELDFSQSVITASSTGGGPTMVLSTTMLVWGVLLTLLSQLAQALQFVSEEILVGRTNLHPLQMLAVEGTLSTVFSMVALGIGVLLPGKDEGGRIESLPDTLQQLGNSTPLLIICLAQFLGVAGNNYFGLRVSSAYRLSFCLVYTRYVVDLYMDNWANRLPACPPTLTGPARQS